MKRIVGIGLSDVQAVYSGPEGKLWELIMGEQIHIGGYESSMELAVRAEIPAGSAGIDLCSCVGGGMRFLVRFRGVRRMVGVDATEHVVEEGRRRVRAEGLDDRIEFVLADACQSGLPDGQADFVWGEDAWCYVVDKPRLISEAARLVKRGGRIAFTDWVEAPTGLTESEARRFLNFMKFPNIQDVQGYAGLLRENGCTVLHAEDTGRFAPCSDLYLNMVGRQLHYDALKILGFDEDAMDFLGGEMIFMQELGRDGKVIQALFIARKD